jgi:TatA/E family protein of Tat protein translocase
VEGLLAPWHLLIIFVVAVLVFGPDKLPEIARQVGRGLHELRKARDSFDDNVRGFLGHDGENRPSEQAKLPPHQEASPKRSLPDTAD